MTQVISAYTYVQNQSFRFIKLVLYSLKYVSECGNEAYYRYNKLLLLKDQREELQSQVLELLDLE